MQKPLRVVPLFETLDDLTNAPGTIRTLLSNDWYRSHINGLQECMIGGWQGQMAAAMISDAIPVQCRRSLNFLCTY